MPPLLAPCATKACSTAHLLCTSSGGSTCHSILALGCLHACAPWLTLPSCPPAPPCSATRQGSTLTFSLRDPSGQYLSWRAAAQAMMEAGLHVSC